MNPLSIPGMHSMAESAGLKVVMFDKGVSAQALCQEAALIRLLKEQHDVRFLPKQVLRRALREGLNPFAH